MTVKQLAMKIGKSEQVVRRDIAILEELDVVRVRGGKPKHYRVSYGFIEA
ncbi:MAG: DeoR family transcriptional regulator [Bacilli bacterium]